MNRKIKCYQDYRKTTTSKGLHRKTEIVFIFVLSVVFNSTTVLQRAQNILFSTQQDLYERPSVTQLSHPVLTV